MPAKPKAPDSRSIPRSPAQSKQPSSTGRAGALGSRTPVPPATEKAQFESYRRAAERGDPNAQMMLGTLYASGKGASRDPKEAAAWYRKAADAGNASAQMLLGTCYAYGNGVQKDATKAVQYFRKAALAGNRMGQYKLGECYAIGTGVPCNEEQAKDWYKKAADQGLTLAKNKLQALEAKKGPSQTAKSPYQPPRNKAVHQKGPRSAAADSGKTSMQDHLSKQAAELKSQGDLKGALKLYKEQEKILREKKDPRALKINLMQQSEIMKELLKALDSQLEDKLRKSRKK
jgi:TPR repeat protein